MSELLSGIEAHDRPARGAGYFFGPFKQPVADTAALGGGGKVVKQGGRLTNEHRIAAAGTRRERRLLRLTVSSRIRTAFRDDLRERLAKVPGGSAVTRGSRTVSTGSTGA